MIQRLTQTLLQSLPVVLLISFLKKVILPGFAGLPLYDVLNFFLQGVKKGSLKTRASSLAFHFFLAIFPCIIFLFTLIPYVPIDNFQDSLMEILEALMPATAFETVESTIDDIINQPRGGLLSFGFLATLYFASNGFVAMINAFNNSYHSIETRSSLMQRVVSIELIIIYFLLAIVAIGLIGYGEFLISTIITQASFSKILIQIGETLVLVLLITSCISFSYFLGPSKRSGFKLISPGSIFSTFLTIITSIGFAFYINNFGQYNKLYGSIGTLIVILLWVYFNSFILLLGFELNASIYSAKKERK